MKIFEGKTQAEKYKIIAAFVLGALAVLAVGYNLIGFFPGRKTTTTAKATPTPTPTALKSGDTLVSSLPPQSEIESVYASTPVIYPLVALGAPDPGRNIFGFYEPPVPTPYSPTPVPVDTRTPPTPIPTPTPPQVIYGFNPPMEYAGSAGFNLDVNGEGFTPETRIFLNNNEMPTTFVSPQRLSTNVPSNFISSGGNLQIFVRTPDGKLYSLPVFFTLQTPPRPQFQYVGIVAPKLGNNTTAYIQEGTNPPVPKRLNDTIGVCRSEPIPGCFKIVSISRDRVIVQDARLGFRYGIDISKGTGQSTSTVTTNPNQNFQNNPNFPNNPNVQPQNIPGIPNLPRYIPPNQNTNPKKDVDDADTDDDGDN